MTTKPIRVNSIILSLCEIIIGVLLLIEPVKFTVTIITFLGIVLVLAGIVGIVQYFRMESAVTALEQGLTRGIIQVVFGVFCIVNNHWFIVAFPVITVIYGIITLITGISKVQWTVDMIRAKIKKWGWVAASAVITIVCAVIILAHPFTSTSVLWIFIAVSLIVEALADIIVAIFAKGPTERNP